jgi:hypothetical protein
MHQIPVPWADVNSLDCNDESLAEESVSTGTYTEELTSAVTNTHMEKSIFTVIYMHIEESAFMGTRNFTEEPTSTLRDIHTEESTSALSLTRTEESTSTVRGTHTYFSTEPQHADHSETNGIHNRTVPQVEEIMHISTHEGRTYNIIILVGVLAFCILAILLIVLLLLFYLRRRRGLYKISKAEIKTQKNRADFSVPAEGPPPL